MFSGFGKLEKSALVRVFNRENPVFDAQTGCGFMGLPCGSFPVLDNFTAHNRFAQCGQPYGF